MTLDGEVTSLDPFTHTDEDRRKILNFDFVKKTVENLSFKTKEEIEEEMEKNRRTLLETKKVSTDETFCTLVTVGGKFLEKKTFQQVFMKIDEIRRIFRV